MQVVSFSCPFWSNWNNLISEVIFGSNDDNNEGSNEEQQNGNRANGEK